MKIQIIHVRDSDSDCSHTVFIDGVRAEDIDADVEVEDIDPGRGYTRSDWQERLDAARAAQVADPTNPFLESLVAELDAASDNRYITGED